MKWWVKISKRKSSGLSSVVRCCSSSYATCSLHVKIGSILPGVGITFNWFDKNTFATDVKNKNVLEFLFYANHLQFGAEPQRQSVHCLSYWNVAPQNAKKVIIACSCAKTKMKTKPRTNVFVHSKSLKVFVLCSFRSFPVMNEPSP